MTTFKIPAKYKRVRIILDKRHKNTGYIYKVDFNKINIKKVKWILA